MAGMPSWGALLGLVAVAGYQNRDKIGEFVKGLSGETTADIIAEIVKINPKPLTEIDSSVPERLDEIVSKTLEKDSNERYQTVKDLIIDLRRLRKKLDLDLELERSHSPSTDTIHSGIARRPRFCGRI